MRTALVVGLLVLAGAEAGSSEEVAVPPRVATLVVCEGTPADPSYARAIAQGYARILDPTAPRAECISSRPERAAPPDGFDALLVVTFRETNLERPSFIGDLELSTAGTRGRFGKTGFIAQRLRIANADHSSTDRLALGSAILPLAFQLQLIPDPFPNSPPDDLPGYDATMELPEPKSGE